MTADRTGEASHINRVC